MEDGLLRIAFGSSSDAVRLLSGEGELSDEEIAALDLFNVSEIRKSKDGVVIRFFDRIRALEALLRWNGGREPTSAQAAGFLEALEKSAKAVGESGESDAV